MGAGFLLLETQVISRLALFFGTTWQVNGVVISALLVALLLANFVVDRTRRSIPRFAILGALIISLALAYALPVNRLPGSPAMAGALATAIFAIPIFFAGILFALEFRIVDSPSAALGANILGAVAGGLLENLSLLFGMNTESDSLNTFCSPPFKPGKAPPALEAPGRGPGSTAPDPPELSEPGGR